MTSHEFTENNNKHPKFDEIRDIEPNSDCLQPNNSLSTESLQDTNKAEDFSSKSPNSKVIGKRRSGTYFPFSKGVHPKSLSTRKILRHKTPRTMISIKISNRKTISSDFLSTYPNLKSITISKSVISIEDSAFRACSQLKEIIVDLDNLHFTSVDGILFCKDNSKIICYPSKRLETNYLIPTSVTSIGESAFSACSNLTSLTIPTSVTSIGQSAFSDCSNLTSITIPTSVTSIGESAFSHCSNLTSITIPTSVTLIGKSAFSHCSNLTSITIPTSVTSIGSYAFSNCSNLTSIINLSPIKLDLVPLLSCGIVQMSLLSPVHTIDSKTIPENEPFHDKHSSDLKNDKYDFCKSHLFFQNIYKDICSQQLDTFISNELELVSLNQFNQYTDYLSINLHTLSFTITRKYNHKNKFIKDKTIFTKSKSQCIMNRNLQICSNINQLIFPFLPFYNLQSFLLKTLPKHSSILRIKDSNRIVWAIEIAMALNDLYTLNSQSNCIYYHGHLSDTSFSVDSNLNVYLTSIEPDEDVKTSNEIPNSWYFRSPDQSSKLDCDIYSFGILLFEIITQTHPQDLFKENESIKYRLEILSKGYHHFEDSRFDKLLQKFTSKNQSLKALADIVYRCIGYPKGKQRESLFTNFSDIIKLLQQLLEKFKTDINNLKMLDSSYKCTLNTLFDHCKSLEGTEYSMEFIFEKIFKSIMNKLPSTDKYSIFLQFILDNYMKPFDLKSIYNAITYEDEFIKQISTIISDEQLFNLLDIPPKDLFTFTYKLLGSEEFSIFLYANQNDRKAYEVFYNPNQNKLYIKRTGDSCESDKQILPNKISKFILQNSHQNFKSAVNIPYFPGYTLFEFLYREDITEEDKIVWIIEIAKAMNDLYNFDFNEDLKTYNDPDNFEEDLTTKKKKKELHGCLSDQSFMIDIHRNAYLTSITNNISEDKSKTQNQSFYFPKSDKEQPKRGNDIYAFGVLVDEIITKSIHAKISSDNNNEVKYRSSRTKCNNKEAHSCLAQESIEDQLREELNELIEKCKDVGKSELTFKEIIEDITNTNFYKQHQKQIEKRLNNAKVYDNSSECDFRTLISAYYLDLCDSKTTQSVIDKTQKNITNKRSQLYRYLQRFYQSIQPDLEDHSKINNNLEFYSNFMESTFTKVVEQLYPQFSRGNHYQIDVSLFNSFSNEIFEQSQFDSGFQQANTIQNEYFNPDKQINYASSFNINNANYMKKFPIIDIKSFCDILYKTHQSQPIDIDSINPNSFLHLNTLHMWAFQIIYSLQIRGIPIVCKPNSTQLSLDDFAIYYNNTTQTFDLDFSPATHLKFIYNFHDLSQRDHSYEIDIRSLGSALIELYSTFYYDDKQYDIYHKVMSFISSAFFNNKEFQCEDFVNFISGLLLNDQQMHNLILEYHPNENDYSPCFANFVKIVLPNFKTLIGCDINIKQFDDFYLNIINIPEKIETNNEKSLNLRNLFPFNTDIPTKKNDYKADIIPYYFKDNANQQIRQNNKKCLDSSLEPIQRLLHLSGYSYSTIEFLLSRYAMQLNPGSAYEISIKIQNVDLYQDGKIKSGYIKQLAHTLNIDTKNENGVLILEVKKKNEELQERVTNELPNITTTMIDFTFNNSDMIKIMQNNLKVSHNILHSNTFFNITLDLSTCEFSIILPNTEVQKVFIETDSKFILHLSDKNESISFPLMAGFDIKTLFREKGNRIFLSEIDKYVIIEEIAIALNDLQNWSQKTQTPYTGCISESSFFMDHLKNVYLCRFMEPNGQALHFKFNDFLYSFGIIANEILLEKIINNVDPQLREEKSDFRQIFEHHDLGNILKNCFTENNNKPMITFQNIIESIHKTSFYKQHKNDIEKRIQDAKYLSTRTNDKSNLYSCTFETLALAYFSQFPNIDSIMKHNLNQVKNLVSNKLASILLQVIINMTDMDNSLNKYIIIFNSFVTIFSKFDMNLPLVVSLKTFYPLIPENDIYYLLELPPDTQRQLDNSNEFEAISQKDSKYGPLFINKINGGLYFKREYKENRQDYENEVNVFTTTKSPFILHCDIQWCDSENLTIYLPFPCGLTIQSIINERKMNLSDADKITWALEIAIAMRDFYKEKAARMHISEANLHPIHLSDMSFFVDINLNVYLSQISYHGNNTLLSSTDIHSCDKNQIPALGDDIYEYGILLHEIFCFTNPKIIPVSIEQITHNFYSTYPDLKDLVASCIEKTLNFPEIILKLKSTKLYQKLMGLIEYRITTGTGMTSICNPSTLIASKMLGMPMNNETAAQYYRRAADRGQMQAMYK